ncbi:hypothetical protein [Roseiterribacter gracilis]
MKSADDARAGVETGHVRWILGISLSAIVVIFVAVLANWITF